jgi:hypothetical protein
MLEVHEILNPMLKTLDYSRPLKPKLIVMKDLKVK